MTGATAACSSTRPGDESTPQPSRQPAFTSPSARRVLLAYFSRPGENYYYGERTNLKVGNTQVLAGMIRDRIDCDVHRIEAADPYPQDYEQTVARNSREQERDARPAIVRLPESLEPYGTVLLASPIWNVRAPMIMTTFTDTFDFRGKTVHPVTTYAMSGLGTTEDDYAAACPGATLAEGLAVRGEEVRKAGDDLDAWLRRTALLRG
ncbi:flavodoxin [uncultured Streptomyces sp.]|uniref:flavodoxin n=1 Tax=uncultured Streptomyces sp. TaxID=174707 RepID=UPI00260B99AC|nr:flavodoxin [uncultured Streptomyces sp.]